MPGTRTARGGRDFHHINRRGFPIPGSPLQPASGVLERGAAPRRGDGDLSRSRPPSACPTLLVVSLYLRSDAVGGGETPVVCYSPPSKLLRTSDRAASQRER